MNHLEAMFLSSPLVKVGSFFVKLSPIHRLGIWFKMIRTSIEHFKTKLTGNVSLREPPQ